MEGGARTAHRASAAFVTLSGWVRQPLHKEECKEMKNFLNRANCFLKSEDGPTATEYAVMLALIIIVALGAITGLGTTVDAIFTNVDDALPSGGSGTGTGS